MGADYLHRYLGSTGSDPSTTEDSEGEANRSLDQTNRRGHQRASGFLFSIDLIPPSTGCGDRGHSAVTSVMGVLGWSMTPKPMAPLAVFPRTVDVAVI
ncbi:hypothetical protein D1007_11894 [Hordeum vulgare]|nr:hypothetical protein D1007_11894 [Hordeum vulgare]